MQPRMSLGQTPLLLILELAEVLGMMREHPSPVCWTICANASSAADLIPQGEQLLSKGLRKERTHERVPLYTRGSTGFTCRVDISAGRAKVWAERQRKVMALLLF